MALRPDTAARHRLIRLLFSEPAHNIADRGRPGVAIAQLLRRAFPDNHHDNHDDAPT